MVLEYLGFVPEMFNIEEGLPEIYPELGYSGVMVGFLGKIDEKLIDWLIKAKEEGLKLFFLNSLPYDEKFYRAFGMIIVWISFKEEKRQLKGYQEAVGCGQRF